MVRRNKYYMKTNESHTTQGVNPIHENEKKLLEARFWPFLAVFLRLGLALGCEVRWFHTLFYIFSTPTELGSSRTP